MCTRLAFAALLLSTTASSRTSFHLSDLISPSAESETHDKSLSGGAEQGNQVEVDKRVSVEEFQMKTTRTPTNSDDIISVTFVVPELGVEPIPISVPCTATWKDANELMRNAVATKLPSGFHFEYLKIMWPRREEYADHGPEDTELFGDEGLGIGDGAKFIGQVDWGKVAEVTLTFLCGMRHVSDLIPDDCFHNSPYGLSRYVFFLYEGNALHLLASWMMHSLANLSLNQTMSPELMMQALLTQKDAGNALTAQSRRGFTPLQIAKKYVQDKMAKLLEEAMGSHAAGT